MGHLEVTSVPARNPLLSAPPFAVEAALKKLGADLRTARVRRKLTLEEVADKIGVSRQVVARAESGKSSIGIAVYAALLWTFGLLEGLADIADPSRDAEGLALIRAREPTKAYRSGALDNDF